MTRYIAFLRGINLGNRRIKMDRLAGLFEELEYPYVATFLASGNVVFDSDADEDDLVVEIEGYLRDRLGYEVDTFIRSMEELREVAQRDVFVDVDGSGRGLYVIFFRERLGSGEAEELNALATEDDGFEVSGREVYWLRNGRLSESPIKSSELSKALGGTTSTMRNMNTVERILDKFAVGE